MLVVGDCYLCYHLVSNRQLSHVCIVSEVECGETDVVDGQNLNHRVEGRDLFERAACKAEVQEVVEGVVVDH